MQIAVVQRQLWTRRIELCYFVTVSIKGLHGWQNCSSCDINAQLAIRTSILEQLSSKLTDFAYSYNFPNRSTGWTHIQRSDHFKLMLFNRFRTLVFRKREAHRVKIQWTPSLVSWQDKIVLHFGCEYSALNAGPYMSWSSVLNGKANSTKL